MRKLTNNETTNSLHSPVLMHGIDNKPLSTEAPLSTKTTSTTPHYEELNKLATPTVWVPRNRDELSHVIMADVTQEEIGTLTKKMKGLGAYSGRHLAGKVMKDGQFEPTIGLAEEFSYKHQQEQLEIYKEMGLNLNTQLAEVRDGGMTDYVLEALHGKYGKTEQKQVCNLFRNREVRHFCTGPKAHEIEYLLHSLGVESKLTGDYEVDEHFNHKGRFLDYITNELKLPAPEGHTVYSTDQALEAFDKLKANGVKKVYFRGSRGASGGANFGPFTSKEAFADELKNNTTLREMFDVDSYQLKGVTPNNVVGGRVEEFLEGLQDSPGVTVTLTDQGIRAETITSQVLNGPKHEGNIWPVKHPHLLPKMKKLVMKLAEDAYKKGVRGTLSFDLGVWHDRSQVGKNNPKTKATESDLTVGVIECNRRDGGTTGQGRHLKYWFQKEINNMEAFLEPNTSFLMRNVQVPLGTTPKQYLDYLSQQGVSPLENRKRCIVPHNLVPAATRLEGVVQALVIGKNREEINELIQVANMTK